MASGLLDGNIGNSVFAGQFKINVNDSMNVDMYVYFTDCAYFSNENMSGRFKLANYCFVIFGQKAGMINLYSLIREKFILAAVGLSSRHHFVGNIVC